MVQQQHLFRIRHHAGEQPNRLEVRHAATGYDIQMPRPRNVAVSYHEEGVGATARFLQGFRARAGAVAWTVTVYGDNEPSIRMALTSSGEEEKPCERSESR